MPNAPQEAPSASSPHARAGRRPHNDPVVLHPEALSVLNMGIPHTAQFNFCPLGPDAKNTSLAARACQIVGGPIYVGHRITKRLKILISNPGSFAPIFLPSGTLVGVMEIFYTRY